MSIRNTLLAIAFISTTFILIFSLKVNAEDVDLLILNDKISISNKEDKINISVEIENSGSSNANDIFVKFLEVSNDIEIIGQYFIDTINATENRTAFIEYDMREGDRKIVVIVDYADNNETNNIAEKYIKIKKKEKLFPDLILKDLTYKNNKIYAEISNFGNASAENFNVLFIDCFYYRNRLYKKAISEIDINEILLNSSVLIERNWTPYLSGYHKIVAIVDSKYIIKEKNKENNIKEIELNLNFENNLIFIRNISEEKQYLPNQEISFEVFLERKNNNFELPIDGILTLNIFDKNNKLILESAKNFYIAYKNSNIKITFFFELPKGDYTAKINLVSLGFLIERETSFKVKEENVIISKTTNKIDISSIAIYLTIGLFSILFAFSNTEIGKLKFLLLLVPLWVKMNKEETQNNFKRGGIYYYIVANPGAHFSEIRDTLNLANGELAYHLKVLEDNGQINSMNDGIRKRFYPKNVEKREPILTKIQKEIFNLVKSKPGINQNEIANNLHKSKQVVNYHIQIMNEMNVVKLQKEKKETKCFAMV